MNIRHKKWAMLARWRRRSQLTATKLRHPNLVAEERFRVARRAELWSIYRINLGIELGLHMKTGQSAHQKQRAVALGIR